MLDISDLGHNIYNSNEYMTYITWSIKSIGFSTFTRLDCSSK